MLIARPAEPVQAQSSAIWSGTMTVETVSQSDAGIFGANFLGAHLIFGSNFAGPSSFEYNGSTVSVNHLYIYNAPPDFDDPDSLPTPTLRFGISPPSASTLSNTLLSLALDSSVFCFNGNDIVDAYDGTEGIAIENHGLSWSVGDTVSVSLTVVTDCAAPPPAGPPEGALVEKEIWSARMHPGERSPAAADYLITGYRDCRDDEDNCTPIGSLEGRDWFELDDFRFNVKAVEVLDIGERAVRVEFDADASMANSLLDRSRLRLYIGNVGYSLSSGQPFYTGDRPAPLFATDRSYRLRLVELVPAEISIVPGKSYIWTGEAPRFTREGVPIPIVWEGQPVPFMLRANGDLVSDLDVTVTISSDLADPFGIKPGEHTVTMQGGWSWEYFELPTRDDDIDGKNGYVTAEVTPVEGSYSVVESPGNMASLAVADNELGKASLMDLRVTADVPYITEGQYAEFTFTANQAQPWDVPFRFEVTARGDQQIPGGIIRKTITIPAGQTSATYRFGTTEYFRIGTGGDITVQLKAPYPYDFDNWYSVHPAYDYATVAVSEAHGSKPTVHVSVNSYGSFATTHPLEITEGEIARFVVTILPGAPSSGLTVKWDAASLTNHLPDCPSDSGDDCKDNRVLPMTTEIPGNGFSQVVEVQTAHDRRACTGSVYLWLTESSDYHVHYKTYSAQVQIRDQGQQDGAPMLPLCPGNSRPLLMPSEPGPRVLTDPSPVVHYSFSVQTGPQANAGPDLTAKAGHRVRLQGTGSFNPYGAASDLTHEWTQVHGTEVALNGANRGDPTFTVPANAANGDTLIFKLTVTDREGASSSDETVVTVSAPPSPTACAGPSLYSREQWEAGETLQPNRGPAPLDFVNDPRGGFSGQHGGHMTVDGNLLVYDNATHCEAPPGAPGGAKGLKQCDTRTRAVEYALDTSNGEIVFLREFRMPETDPPRSVGGFAGHAEPMDNGDWMISWSNPFSSRFPSPAPMPNSAMQVDARTGTEKLSMTVWNLLGNRGVNEPHNVRVVTVSPVALASRVEALSASFSTWGSTSAFHTGAADTPQVVVAFNRPVVDFGADSPSLSVSGGTVAGVSAHIADGAPANAYLITLTPDGDGAVNVRLLTGQPCADGGICTADGATLSDAPAALVLSTAQVCAGPDVSGAPGEQVTLQGEQGDCDPGANGEPQPAYAWTQLSGPSVSINDATQRALSFTIPDAADVGAVLEFRLTLTDSEGRTGSDTVIVTVVPPKPTACAGPDLSGAPGEEVTLQGRCSKNPYGPWHRLAHTWTQLSGPAVTLDGVNRGDPSFAIPEDAADGAALEFQLTVTDEQGKTDSDSMIVTVDSTPRATPPTACAGPNLIGAPGETVTLEGHCSTNPHGVWWRMDHLWTQPEGQHIALSDVSRARPSFTVPADAGDGTVYRFTLTVTDIDGEHDSDSMKVTVVWPTPPTACAGPDLEARPGDEVTLEGDCSTNPHGALWVLDYLWAQPVGQDITLSGAARWRPTFSVPSDAAPGTVYSFTLEVTDEDDETDADGMTVTVIAATGESRSNQAPAFTDGVNTSRKLDERSPAGTNVGGAVAATDADGDSLTFALSGTDAGEFAIDDESGQITTIAGRGYVYAEQPLYRVVVTADDGNGGVATIDVVINIQDKNDPPRFVEGASATRSIAENPPPGTRVGDLFLATDPEVNPLTYSISGTDAGSFTMDQYTGYLKTKAGVVYDFETKPTYELNVVATDPGGLSASIAVTVTLVDVAEAAQEPDPQPTVNAVTLCFTDLGSLAAAVEYAGSWDDAECQAHHAASRARYFHFTLAEQTEVAINLSAGDIYVSRDTPKNGWGKVPGPGYEHRLSVRRDNGKLVHDGANAPTLSLAAGTYTVEVAGSGTFTISISPQ